MSEEQKKYLKEYKLNKFFILISQSLILILFIITWELLSKYKIINPFIFSSPSKVIKTIINLYKSNNLITHILTTLKETMISFIIGTILSFIIATIFYFSKTIYKVFDPFLNCFNSLPKVALGPMIIIIFGAQTKSIIIMGILINIIVCTSIITTSFYSTDEIKIKLMKSFNASKYQILKYLVIPSSYESIISSFKITISMSLIGIISGEFLVSKQGLGYLIIYGTQVFNLNLVISSLIILLTISYLLYKLIEKIEKLLTRS